MNIRVFSGVCRNGEGSAIAVIKEGMCTSGKVRA